MKNFRTNTMDWLQKALYRVPEFVLRQHLEQRTPYLELNGRIQSAVMLDDTDGALRASCSMFRLLDTTQWRMYATFHKRVQLGLQVAAVGLLLAGFFLISKGEAWRLYLCIGASFSFVALSGLVQLWMRVLGDRLRASRSSRMTGFIQASLSEQGMPIVINEKLPDNQN